MIEPVRDERAPHHAALTTLGARGRRWLAARWQQAIAPMAPHAFLSAFGSTFITILLAEMGDKTQLATLLMSAESQAPLAVWSGAAAALVATSLLGVTLGWWLANRLPRRVLQIAIATLLLAVSAWLVGDAVRV